MVWIEALMTSSSLRKVRYSQLKEFRDPYENEVDPFVSSECFSISFFFLSVFYLLIFVQNLFLPLDDNNVFFFLWGGGREEIKAGN